MSAPVYHVPFAASFGRFSISPFSILFGATRLTHDI